jgi:16S rRNA processing protein RimM
MAFRPAWTSSTTERSLLTVGRVTRAHGLRGEVIVHLWSDQTQRLDPGSILESGRGPLTVRQSRPMGGAGSEGDRLRSFIVQFDGVEDRDAAERLHGVDLMAESLEVPGALWVHQLVGAMVRDGEGTEVGRIAAVEANPASDLLVLESGGLIPANFVVGHNPASGTVEVDIPEGLLDL